MARCWYADPEERPDFSELCTIMEQFLSLVADYTEPKIELIEAVEGKWNVLATLSVKEKVLVYL